MLETIIICFIFGLVIGGATTVIVFILLYAIKPEIFSDLALKWHTYWTKYHSRILNDLGEVGGTFDQYYTDEFRYHLKKFEWHQGKVGE